MSPAKWRASYVAMCSAVAGLVGGIVDGIMMRFVDILLSIPFLLIVLVLATKYSATVIAESIIIGLFSWLIPARLVRGEVLTLRTRDFVHAARTMGSTRRRCKSANGDHAFDCSARPLRDKRRSSTPRHAFIRRLLRAAGAAR